MKKQTILSHLRNTLIVSCQSSENNPLYTDEHMLLLAEASYRSGCRVFRVDTPSTVKLIKENYDDVLVIALYKRHYPGSDVFITPTLKEVRELVAAGADILAVQSTCNIGPDGLQASAIIPKIKHEFPNIPIMADISTLEECILSDSLGADIISTTLRGYTPQSSVAAQNEFDIEFLKSIRQSTKKFVVAEGKIWTPYDASSALKAGADAIVVGTAINNPMLITSRFKEAISHEH